MNPATKRKQEQRARRAALGINLRIARAGSGEPYSADEYISTLIRRDWERWLEQEAELKQQTCPNCDCALPEGCGGTFKGEPSCWLTTGEKEIAL